MRQAHFRHEFSRGFRTFPQGGEQPCYLVAYLVVSLVDPKCLQKNPQHERNERRALACRRTLPDGFVEVALPDTKS